MKVYYILSVLSPQDKDFFFETIKEVTCPSDIDRLIETKYYRVDDHRKGTTYNSITLETWMFIKEIYNKYGIPPSEINWVYRQNMVILNDDLWLFNNGEWERVSGEKDIYFFTSRYSFQNPFWSLWEKLSQINDNFPKLVYPNKNLTYTRKEKIRFILEAYKKREEVIGNFMLPLMYTRNIESIRNVLLLWKQEVGEKYILLKKSWGTDNGKHITLIDVDAFLKNDQSIEYLFLKYISKISEFNPDLYFSSYYDIEKEYRLYYALDTKTKKYNLYSVKQKVNLTSKEEIASKTTLSTGRNVKVDWKVLDKKDVSKYLDKMAKYILQKNDIEVGVIEFVQLKDKSYRFLEINCLGGSMMFAGKDEEDIKKLISDWWDSMFYKYL